MPVEREDDIRMTKDKPKWATRKDTCVRCRKCGKERNLSFLQSMKDGWPLCHGETMILLTTTADINLAMINLIDESPKGITMLKDKIQP